jgi:hypothetical protein
MVRTLDGTARAFLSDRYQPFDNDLVASCGALETLQDVAPGMVVQSADLTPTKLYIKASFPGDPARGQKGRCCRVRRSDLELAKSGRVRSMLRRGRRG